MEPLNDRIRKIYHEMIQEFEHDPAKFISLAGIYKELGDTDKALSILQNGLKNNKSNVCARMLVAEILYDRWLIDETKKYLEDTLNDAPNNEMALEMLYNIYVSEENFRKARDILNLKLVFCNNKDEILSFIDIINTNFNKLPRITDISKNIRAKLTDQGLTAEYSSTDIVNTNEKTADFYINQGNYSKAVEILEQLIKQNPKDIHLRTRLSLCQASKMFGKNFVDNKKGILKI